MLFNSSAYAVFLPVVFGLYWLIPHKYRWLFLLVASYFFYMNWNPRYVVLIILTTGVSYTCGIMLSKTHRVWERKLLLILAISVSLGILFFFKYFNFIAQNVSSIMGFFSIAPHQITIRYLLPVGISFYTFQTLSYVMDIYRGGEPEKNFGVYATYISFFPQLIAGPIERAYNLLPQIKSEKGFDYEKALYGTRLILWGLFKKIAIADTCSIYVDKVYMDVSQCYGADCILAVFLFTIQIYCDFSGYSDIAIGSAKLFGIDLMTNFRSPYYSCSVKEFWNRWHISLSTWFRDYLYIPLGGNRGVKWKQYRNTILTFLVSGLWHGANWTFVVWGGIHGFAQILESVFNLHGRCRSQIGKLVSWLLVFVFCSYAWVFFRADTINDALILIYHTFSGLPDLSYYCHTNVGLTLKSFIFISSMVAMVGIYDFCSIKFDVLAEIARFTRGKRVVCIIVEYVLVAIIIYSIENGVNANQFVYFQF